MPPESVPVSVIMPAYNAAATIARALASIAGQTLPPMEVIVVDDGSRDGTAEIAERFAAEIGAAKLTVIRQQNKGAGAARNRAVDAATQPYLAFLDADDEWLPTKLERSMNVMIEGDYLLVAHDYLDATENGDVHVDCARRFQESSDPYVQLYLKGYIPSISVITRRDAVIAAGGFDESLRNAQDFDLWLKLLAEPGIRFTLFGEAMARYHHSAGSIMTHTDRRIACCTEIARRYAPTLKARGQPVYKNLMTRIVYIYMEAARAHPNKKLPYLFKGAVVAMLVMIKTSIPDSDPYVPESPALPILSAVWVFGVLGVYLWQFKDLLGPILLSLGFKF